MEADKYQLIKGWAPVNTWRNLVPMVRMYASTHKMYFVQPVQAQCAVALAPSQHRVAVLRIWLGFACGEQILTTLSSITYYLHFHLR